MLNQSSVSVIANLHKLAESSTNLFKKDFSNLKAKLKEIIQAATPTEQPLPEPESRLQSSGNNQVEIPHIPQPSAQVKST
jgi:hypothetical protein